MEKLISSLAKKTI
jgi:uncharacterized CHY-type Zn-finger protein